MLTDDKIIKDLRYDSLNMKLIERINKKYKFKLKKITHNTLHVDSGTDEWVLEVENKRNKEHKNLVLYHKNHKRNTNRHHKHRRFYNYSWVFGAIHNHEQRWFKSLNKMNRLLDKINQIATKSNKG